jgi:lipopolysaccharide transport system permease protein
VSEPVRVFKPGFVGEGGILKVLPRMVRELVGAREMIWQLFLRDFKARYRQSLLGWVWIFLAPMVTMGTFLLLNVSGVIRIGEIPVPYPVFGLLGVTMWQVFSGGLGNLTGSVLAAGSLVGKINFPRDILVVSALGQTMVDLFVRWGLILGVYILYGLSPSIWFWLFPFLGLPILLLTAGLGFLTSLINVVVRDTQSIVNIGVNFFLFLMPIMYTMPEKGLLMRLNRVNPVFFLIETPRELVISGKASYLLEFAISSTVALVVFLVGWFVFYMSQPKLAERI